MNLFKFLIRLNCIFLSLTLVSNLRGQPQKINYQAIALNNSNQLVKNQMISVRLSILDSNINGSTIYSEVHRPTTDVYGQFSIFLGTGSPLFSNFSNVNWKTNADKFLKSEIDLTGGNNFVLSGTSQIVSVPFALHSNTSNLLSDSIGNTYKVSLINGIPTIVTNSTVSTQNLPKAILFMESADDALGTGPQSTDILSYMLTNASGWYGFRTSGLPLARDTNDIKVWMDWPGFKNGSNNVPSCKLSDIPQTSGGTDNYGNFQSQYKFKTIEVQANSLKGSVHFIVLAPKNGLNNGLNLYNSIGINYNGSPQSLTSPSTDSNLRGIRFNYVGNNFPNGVYYIFTNGSGNGYTRGSQGTFNSSNYYFKGQ